MSLSGHFNKRAVSKDRIGREVQYFEDFRTARLSHGDGSSADYKGGKQVPGSFVAAKHVAKEDVQDKSKYMPTPVVTIVAEPAVKEKQNQVRKDFDVNTQAMKL